MRMPWLTIALLVLISGSAAAADPSPSPTPTPGFKSAPPYSETLSAGDTLYVAGHLGTDAAGKIPQDASAEARLALDAIKAAVERAGLSMDDLVAVTVYCTDLNLFEAFNAVYRGYFHSRFPTRAFIGVNRLLIGAHFEISAIGVRSHGARSP